MPLKVLQWQFNTPTGVPEALIEDDSAEFASDTVRRVKEWLQSTVPEQKITKPQDIVIDLSAKVDNDEPVIQFKGVPRTLINGVVFQHGQFEICLRDRVSTAILVKYSYVGARDLMNRVILGPKLYHTVLGRFDGSLRIPR